MHYRRILFRVAYASIYLLFYCLLLGLLLVTISDSITKALENKQTYNVWFITIAIVVVVVVVVFVYVFRLYINKTALASIPKAWVPVEKGDVKDVVYKMIAVGLNRSALIAFEAQPRVDRAARQPSPSKAKTAAQELSVALPPPCAVWGDIEHHGWASPLSPDMPSLQYASVLVELPHLVEGKALALAPTDSTAPTGPPMVDPEAAVLLQRSPGMSLRGYVYHLADIGVVPAGTTTAEFVSQYEHARFSNRPISNARFRDLMHLFAEVLRAMRPVDLVALSGGWATAASSDSDIDNDAPLNTDPPSPRSTLSRAETASSQGSTRRRMRQASAAGWGAGMTLREANAGGANFAQSRRPYPASQASSSSLRTRASSSGAGSVIRLAAREDAGALPYVLDLSGTVGSSG